MNEIYWITRFDGIHCVLVTFLVISAVLSAIFTIVYIINYCNQQEFNNEEYKAYQKLATKFLKITIPIFIFSCLGTVFVPKTKDALLIYGVGGTIDYVKSNPTAKQLPDKCINALDKWVDSWFIEKSDSTNKIKD